MVLVSKLMAGDLEKQSLEHIPASPDNAASDSKRGAAKAQMPRTLNPHLLGYRGYLSLAVIFVHLHHREQQDPERSSLHKLAERFRCHRGVSLFFILSSFTLTLNLLEKWPAQQLGVRATLLLWVDYGVRRIFRIYPPFIAIVLALKLVPEWGRTYFGGSSDGSINVWRLLTMQEKGAKLALLWTLPPELQYYLIIPVLVTAYKWGEAADLQRAEKHSRKNGFTPPWPVVFRAAAVAPFAILALIQPYVYSTSAALADPAMHASLSYFYCVFFSGSAAAILLYNLQLARRAAPLETLTMQPLISASPAGQSAQKFGADSKVRRRFNPQSGHDWYRWCANRAGIWKGVLYVALWFSFVLRMDFPYLIREDFKRIPDLPFMAMGVAAVFLTSAWPSTTIGSYNWVFTSRLFLSAGAMGYSVYLWHPIAIYIVYESGYRWPVSIPFTYAIALVFGYLGQRFVEAPFVRLGSLTAKRLVRFFSAV